MEVASSKSRWMTAAAVDDRMEGELDAQAEGAGAWEGEREGQ